MRFWIIIIFLLKKLIKQIAIMKFLNFALRYLAFDFNYLSLYYSSSVQNQIYTQNLIMMIIFSYIRVLLSNYHIEKQIYIKISFREKDNFFFTSSIWMIWIKK